MAVMHRELPGLFEIKFEKSTEFLVIVDEENRNHIIIMQNQGVFADNATLIPRSDSRSSLPEADNISGRDDMTGFYPE